MSKHIAIGLHRNAENIPSNLRSSLATILFTRSLSDGHSPAARYLACLELLGVGARNIKPNEKVLKDVSQEITKESMKGGLLRSNKTQRDKNLIAMINVVQERALVKKENPAYSKEDKQLLRQVLYSFY